MISLNKHVSNDKKVCLHAAFRGINEEAEQNNRESVEVRVIVVTKE